MKAKIQEVAGLIYTDRYVIISNKPNEALTINNILRANFLKGRVRFRADQ
jgi:hypothetical protein